MTPQPMTDEDVSVTSTAKSSGSLGRRTPLLATDGSRHPHVVNVTTWTAAILMIASGYIHLHLYDIAYKHVATIGPLFVLQGVASIVFAIGASIVRRVWTALIGAGTMVATLGAFLISVNYGLFGFQDSFTGTNAIGAFVIEIASAALFLSAVVLSLTGRSARSARAGGPTRPTEDG
jgi:hypothetical protein